MSRPLQMLVLVFAGEIIFGLPFHTARFFRPTLLESFGLTNTQLGDAFAVYGVLAMLAYFPGGALADRFAARSLLTVSLLATGVGGLYMATYPGAAGMGWLYGYWGITTILLFWAALIKATRDWGGDTSQGRAFGILEGGRGLVAALVATLGVAVYALALPGDVEVVSSEARRSAFRSVILLYSIAAVVAALLAWLLLPRNNSTRSEEGYVLRNSLHVLTRPLVWAQAAIIICAYCAYKGLDNYSLYAVDVLGMDEIDAAKLAAGGGYIRPIAAVIAGIIADRWSATKMIGTCFLVLIGSYGILSIALPQGPMLPLIYANLIVSFFAVFALRGVYFALMQENGAPQFLTGAVAGTVSFIGYTPEIFFGPITGRILDATPGVGGHQHYFLLLAAIMVCGVIVVAWLLRLQRRTPAAQWPAHDADALK